MPRMLQLLAAHLADGEGPHRVAQPLRRDPEHLRHRDRRQQVRHRVPPRQPRFVIHAERAKARAVRAELDRLRAHIGALRKSERDRAARMRVAESARRARSSAFSTATPSGGSASISSRLAAATPSIESKNSTCAYPTLVTTPMSGRAISASRAISPRVIHSHFQHRRAAAVRQPQNRERHADVIVQIADRPADRHLRREQVRDGVLRRRLARAARHPDHRPAPLLPRPLPESAASAQSVSATIKRRRAWPPAAPFHHHRRRALFHARRRRTRARRSSARAAQSRHRPDSVSACPRSSP